MSRGVARRRGFGRATVAVPAALCAMIVGLAGCGGKSAVGDRIAGNTLTIYTSVPLRGASSVSGEAVLGGERLALARIGARIGHYRIALKPLDDTTPQSSEWDPGQTTLNAREASQDRTTIGYIGELNSGASAISIPLLNRAGVAQISPTSTAVGLTTDAPGAAPGEPQKYYPTGVRTYARVVPNDSAQAAAMVKLQLSVGCTKTYVLEDGEVDGEDLATTFALAARSSPLQVLAVQMFDRRASDYLSLASAVAQTGANCVLISAITENNAVLLTKQIAAALPHALIFGSAGMAETTYANPEQGGIPSTLDSRVLITVATLDPSVSPPGARAFMSQYALHYGSPEPAAIFGYEAMSLMLSAITRATDHGTDPARRSRVVAAIFATRNRRSVLGTYSIDRDGDTTLKGYGVYRVVAGQLTFWKAIEA